MSNTSAIIDPSTIVEAGTTIGHQYHPAAGPTRIGANGIVRIGTIIYGDVTIGDYFQSGHYTIIRAKVTIGNYCAIGNHTTLEGLVTMGNGVRIMHHVYIPSRTRFGNNIFVGPGCNFLNDRKPGRHGRLVVPEGPTIDDEVVIGGGCTILPGVRIGVCSFIAAGTLVTKDVPPNTFVKGSPGRFYDMPKDLDRPNDRSLCIQPLDLWHPLSKTLPDK